MGVEIANFNNNRITLMTMRIEIAPNLNHRITLMTISEMFCLLYICIVISYPVQQCYFFLLLLLKKLLF